LNLRLQALEDSVRQNEKLLSDAKTDRERREQEYQVGYLLVAVAVRRVSACVYLFFACLCARLWRLFYVLRKLSLAFDIATSTWM
jgi:hypothetical protein